MRRLLFTATALLVSCNASLAQVSTMGTTAMGLSSTPGTIVTSPLGGPSPFSAATLPGTPDTTLAPEPLASDPAIPGTVVTCRTGRADQPRNAGGAGYFAVVNGRPGRNDATASAAPMAVPAASSMPATGSGTAPLLTLSAQPATSFMTDLPGTTLPAPQPLPLPPLPSPNITALPTPSTVPNTAATFHAGHESHDFGIDGDGHRSQ